MGQTDTAYGNIPRVRFFWSKREKNHSWIVRKSKPSKPKHKSIPVKNAQTKQPSTSRLSHYQHFMLMWRDQQHSRKTTWVLSIMVETYELLRLLGDEINLHTLWHTLTIYSHARSHILWATEISGLVSFESIWHENSVQNNRIISNTLIFFTALHCLQ